ncbi:MAG: exodeoxyribonuclease VII large subunit [Acetivibrio sp.]
MSEQIYSVSQVNQYIKNLFVRETILSQIYVKGEVSNCKYHSSGHIYFTLKDGKGQMACVMFAGQRDGLSFRMSEGQSVVVLGSINVYERDGKYQMYAKEILLDGAGAFHERYEQLKKKLEEEGLFDEKYKSPIKKYNSRIGIVTANTGAAIQDIINITNRRNPYAQLFLYPAKVQGDGAKDTIIAGIEYLDQFGVDVIIVGRGGGSIEDLWAFNEEAVAWAIFNCTTPVISAVGHETDTTIADYVADLRAPTPSAAAELAVINLFELEHYFENMQYTLERFMQNHLSKAKGVMENYKLRLSHEEPIYLLRQKRQYLLDLEEKLQTRMKDKVQKQRYLLTVYIEKIKGLSPIDRLNKGFSYVSKEDSKTVRSIKDIKIGDTIFIELKDGEIKAVVEKCKKVRRI